MNRFTKKMIIGGSILFLSTLSCRPVITVGWGEMLIISVLLLLLLTPFLIRIYRFFRKNGQNHDRSDQES